MGDVRDHGLTVEVCSFDRAHVTRIIIADDIYPFGPAFTVALAERPLSRHADDNRRPHRQISGNWLVR